MQTTTRLRGFLRVLTLSALAACGGASGAAGTGVIIGFVGDGGEASRQALRGIRLGTAEASRTADLVGRRFRVLEADVASPDAAADAVRALVREGASAIVGGFDTDTCLAIARAARDAGVLFMNVGCRADSLRDADLSTSFHVEAAETSYEQARTTTTDVTLRPVLWHGALERFGAAQLNERFERETGALPDGQAWAAWMAVKALWEAALEVGGSDPDAIGAFLLDERAVFDGHKGDQLRFDAATRQLLQPLYLVNPATLPTTMAEMIRDRAVPGAGGDPIPLDGPDYVFVSNEGSADVTVIDPSSNVTVARIPVGARPRGIHVAPDGRRLYVALSDAAPLAENDGDAIVAFDIRAGEIVARHRAGSDPEQFSLSPDGGFLYAANEDAGTASIADLDSGLVLASLIVGIEPEGVATSPDGRWVYVTAETSNTVSVIDTERHEVVASFLVDSRPRAVAFSPTRPRAYVTNEISGTLSVIDTGSHRVIESVLLDDGRAKPVGVAVSPDGARVYVATGHANGVSVIDGSTNALVAEVPVGRRPWGIAVSSDGSRVYTANGLSNDVSVIDADALRVVATIPVGDRPWGVAVMP